MKKLFLVSILLLTLPMTYAQALSLVKIYKIVLKAYKGPSNYKKTWYTKNLMLLQDKIIDPYSGRECNIKEMHIDHIWPKSKGGPNYSWNLIPSCSKENIQKGNKMGIITIKGYYEKIKQLLLFEIKSYICK